MSLLARVRSALARASVLMVDRATLYNVPRTRSAAGIAERGTPVAVSEDVPCSRQSANKLRLDDHGQEEMYVSYNVLFMVDVSLRPGDLLTVTGGDGVDTPMLVVAAYSEATAGVGMGWAAECGVRT